MATYTKEIALYDHGAIDEGLDDASKTATSYLTTVSGTTGISVHDIDDEDNFININSDGMDIYRDSDLVAHFGTITRLGKENEARMTVSPTSISAVNSYQVEGFRIELNANSITTPVIGVNPHIGSGNSYTADFLTTPSDGMGTVMDTGNYGFIPVEWYIPVIPSRLTANATRGDVVIESRSNTTSLLRLHMPFAGFSLSYGTSSSISSQVTLTIASSGTYTSTVELKYVHTGSTDKLIFTAGDLNGFDVTYFETPLIEWEDTVPYSTAITAGTRNSNVSVGAFSAAMGLGLRASEIGHAAFGRFNHDVLTDNGVLLLSVGDGSSDVLRSNMFAVGTEGIYLGLDEEPSSGSIDYKILEELSNLGWDSVLTGYYDEEDE